MRPVGEVRVAVVQAATAATAAQAAEPRRVQLSRAKGWRMPPNTVSVARPTLWGNPFRIGMLGVPDAAAAVALFERALRRRDLRDDDRRFVFSPDRLRAFLGGKNLACWCRLGEPCHADVLLRLANPRSRFGARR